MVELIDDALVFAFPEVHPDARLRVHFKRTLRIPDNDKTYPLPPALGSFAVRHVDDFRNRVPPSWIAHGGVMLPMYQSEAMWLHFEGQWNDEHGVYYPCAVKIAAGKIDAIAGTAWTNDLHRSPQDYVVVPDQPWLDGFVVGKGVIRQFVAMPLGSGYSAEEQLTGAAEHGGVQIVVRPMQRAEFERFPKRPRHARVMFPAMETGAMAFGHDMALAAGGRMKQEIFKDRYGVDVWDSAARSRCFVHLANSLVWEAITETKPPYPPMTAAEYSRHQLPWFDYYAEARTVLEGGQTLKQLRSVIEIARQKSEVPLPENEDVTPDPVIPLRPRSRHQVRDGMF